jgi:hypothetical protein
VLYLDEMPSHAKASECHFTGSRTRPAEYGLLAGLSIIHTADAAAELASTQQMQQRSWPELTGR